MSTHTFLYRHGLSQRKNPWSDGPEYITQCPIQPKSEFIYEIKFEDEEGTLWWHAHSDWVRATVHGAIVVKPAEGTTYPFDEPADDFVIILGKLISVWKFWVQYRTALNIYTRRK